MTGWLFEMGSLTLPGLTGWLKTELGQGQETADQGSDENCEWTCFTCSPDCVTECDCRQ